MESILASHSAAPGSIHAISQKDFFTCIYSRDYSLDVADLIDGMLRCLDSRQSKKALKLLIKPIHHLLVANKYNKKNISEYLGSGHTFLKIWPTLAYCSITFIFSPYGSENLQPAIFDLGSSELRARTLTATPPPHKAIAIYQKRRNNQKPFKNENRDE